MDWALQRILKEQNYKTSRWAARHPTICIVLPALLFFVLAYPVLLGDQYSHHPSSSYLSKIDVEHLSPDSPTDLSLTQVWIIPKNGTNILNKGYLLESLAFQNRLLENLTALSTVVSIQSPFELWNNSLSLLQEDVSPLRTINLKLRSLPKYLFRRVMKVNGYVTSAGNVVISLLAKDEDREEMKRILRYNVAQLRSISNITNFQIISSEDKPLDISGQEVLKFTLMSFKKIDFVIFFLMYLSIFGYFCYRISNMHSVKSRFGIALAVTFELLLSVSSSLTLTNLLFKNSNENVPNNLMYIPVFTTCLSTILRLLKGTAGSILTDLDDSVAIAVKEEEEFSAAPVQRNFITAAAESNESSFKTMITCILITVFIIPFNRKVSFFIVCSLVANFLLQISYFTSILSLDYRRFNSNDLLFLANNGEGINVSLDDESARKKEYWFPYIQKVNMAADLMSAKPSIPLLIYLIYISRRFHAVRSSSSLAHKILYGRFSRLIYFTKPQARILFDQNFIARKLMDIYGSGSYLLNLSLDEQIYAVKQNSSISNESLHRITEIYHSSIVSSYKFDFYYFFEFMVLVILLIASSLLILQLLLKNVDSNYNMEVRGRTSGNRSGSEISSDVSSSRKDDKTAFHIRELSINGHSLDIIKICTSQSPFIVSVGLDHKVFVWSPLSKPVPSPTAIPLARKYWPLADAVISNDGNYTAFFSRSGKVTCWSRKRMDFIWSLHLQNLENGPLESFFRKRTVPVFMRKRKMNLASDLSGKINGSSSFPRSRRNSNVSISSMRSVASITTTKNGPVDALYENTTSKASEEEELDEFVFVSKDGLINVINNEGELTSSKLTNSNYGLISCKRLITPRVNDRLVACDRLGEIYISTVVNNKWRTRKLIILKNRFNKGEKLMTPAALKRNGFGNVDSVGENHNKFVSSGDVTLLIVPFVGMILLAKKTEAELIDAQTGTSIKIFQISEYKPGSLRVFHDQPTHCRFCGSASVASFSIAYTAKEDSTLVMHAFQLESRTKTSICLRVERDPREIRCLGLEAVVERKHYLPNIEGWNFTENNMIIGIRRKDDRIESKTGSSSMMRSSSEETLTALSKLQSRVKSKRMTTSKSVDYNIHNIWEGWTMTVNGKVSFHKIPMGVNGLLVNKIGPFEKFGAKSIVVTFGNIMKMFYLGNEELILSPDDVSSNEQDTGLKFVNRRRDKLTNKKVSTNYSKY